MKKPVLRKFDRSLLVDILIRLQYRQEMRYLAAVLFELDVRSEIEVRNECGRALYLSVSHQA
ncbi:Uncharacterised protein [Mycobacteroides abscessus subsp. abscessus]|nr:Uncharacterised protein [Mycobacteroides abscessus subsp. abscessus]